MSALEAGDAGRLRVGTFQSVGTKIIPTLLRRFGESHPGVEVLLRESQDESELLEMIERGELDLTFWTLPVSVGGPYEIVELLSDPYVLLVPGLPPRRAGADADAQGDRSAAAHRLQQMQCDGAGRSAAVRRGPRSQLRVPLGQQRHRPGPRRGGRGSQRLAATDRGRGRSERRRRRPPRSHPPRVIGLVWHRDRHQSPASAAFVDSAIAVVASSPPSPQPRSRSGRVGAAIRPRSGRLQGSSASGCAR